MVLNQGLQQVWNYYMRYRSTNRTSFMQPKTFLKTLASIHFSLSAGLIAFAAFAYWKQGGFVAGIDSEDFFIYIVPIFAATGYFLGKTLYQKNIEKITREASLTSKLGKYQNASIIKYALVEGPALIALVAYYLKGNAMHLAIAAFLILYLFSQRPTKQKLLTELQLTAQEKEAL